MSGRHGPNPVVHGGWGQHKQQGGKGPAEQAAKKAWQQETQCGVGRQLNEEPAAWKHLALGLVTEAELGVAQVAPQGRDQKTREIGCGYGESNTGK